MAALDRGQIEQQLKNIIIDRLEVEEASIQPSAKLRDDLGIDSFGFVELLFEVKDKFGVEIKDQDFPSIETLNDVIDHILKK